MIKLAYVTLCIKEIGTDTLGQHFLDPFFATEPSKDKVFLHDLEIEAWGVGFFFFFFFLFFFPFSMYICVWHMYACSCGEGVHMYMWGYVCTCK